MQHRGGAVSMAHDVEVPSADQLPHPPPPRKTRAGPQVRFRTVVLSLVGLFAAVGLLVGLRATLRQRSPRVSIGRALGLRDDEQPANVGVNPRSRSRRPLNDPFWKQFHNMTFVYTWVNGSDPLFIEQRAAAGRGGGESRYRETDELRHSMRLLSLFFPWHTGDVVLVTPNGVAPTWLNRSHPRVRIVNQYDIISKEHHPAFNSAVIEQNLHRIPNLSDIFVHLNDDYMFGRPVHVSDLVTDDGGVRLYHDSNTLASNAVSKYKSYASHGKQIWIQSVYHTAALLQEAFEDGGAVRHFVKHAPFVYSKKVFEFIHKRFGNELFESGKNHFRHGTDILIPFLHHNILKEAPKHELNVPYEDHVGLSGGIDSVLCIVKDNNHDTLRKMLEHTLHPHMFFTVNDGFKFPESAEMLRAFLFRIAPFPGEFEMMPPPEHSGDSIAPIPGTDGFSYHIRPHVMQWTDDLGHLKLLAAQHVRHALPAQLRYSAPAAIDPLFVREETYRRWVAKHWRRGEHVHADAFEYAKAGVSAAMGGPVEAAIENAFAHARKKQANRSARLPDPCEPHEGLTPSCLAAAFLSAPVHAEKNTKSSPRKTYEIIPDCVGVDAVFTWVNGSNLEVLLDMAHYGANAVDSLAQRVRDFGQLRYGLRSVRKYVPWIRHIWVVSGTPKPVWLDDGSPYVSYVPHSAIFAADELPQLQSNSIQSRLHRVPHLADRFLTLDDDYMFIDHVPPERLLGRDLRGMRTWYSNSWNPKVFKSGSVHKVYSTRTESLVRSTLASEDRRDGRTHDNAGTTFLVNRHVPVPIDALFFEEAYTTFEAAYRTNAEHKLRDAADFEPFFGYLFYYVGKRERALQAHAQEGTPVLLRTAQRNVQNDVDRYLCRLAGAPVETWNATHRKAMEGVLGSDTTTCDSGACRERLVRRLSDLVYGVDHPEIAPEKVGQFFMMKNTESVREARRILDKPERRRTRVTTCLNDDIPDRIPEGLVDELADLLENLLPEPASWELDRA